MYTSISLVCSYIVVSPIASAADHTEIHMYV